MYNRDTPNPYAQYTATKVYIRHRREKTTLNTGGGRQGLNSYGNNCTLGYINRNNR